MFTVVPEQFTMVHFRKGSFGQNGFVFSFIFFLLIQIYIWNSCLCSEEVRKISVFTLYGLREIDWFSNRLGQKLLRCSTEQTET